jgi:hypothetical protein
MWSTPLETIYEVVYDPTSDEPLTEEKYFNPFTYGLQEPLTHDEGYLQPYIIP